MRITFLLFAILSTGVLFAQTPIAYGDNFTDNISTFGEEKIYTFQGQTGDRIYVRMRDAETPIDACYTILDPSGAVIDDPCGNGGIVMSKDLRLTEDGTYTIIAKDAGANDTGNFGLSLSKLNAPSYATPIDCQYDATQTLVHSTEVKTFSFDAEEGDKILVRMRGVNVHIESEVEIYNSAGDILARDAGSGLSAIRSFTIPATATYTMLAMDKNGNDIGNFGISLQTINKNTCTLPLVCGDNLEGEFEHLAQMIAYNIEVQEFDRLLFNARCSNTSFESQLFLYNPAGEQIYFTPGEGKQQEVITEKLPAGNYQVVYLDKGGNDLGTYGLSLQVIGVNNCGDAITCFEDEVVTDLPSLSSMRACKFYCAENDIVDIKSIAIDKEIDPLLNIYSTSGELVFTAESFHTTEIDDLLIEESGEYLVIMKDKSGNDLGELTLEIEPENVSPAPTLAFLPQIEIGCGESITPPTANMPCGVEITGTASLDQLSTPGIYEITWTYENSAGNHSSQIQSVVVADQSVPTILCNETLTLSLNENGEVILSETDFANFITDDCSGVDWIEISNQFFTCDNIGENTITIWTADHAGNETSCSITVEINDEFTNCNSCEELPIPWKQKDIGNGTLEGSACYNPADQTFEVTGNGIDIFGTDDEFTFVYQEFCGDAELVAKVKTIDGSADYAFAGIMMRQSFGPGVRYAGLLATNHKGVLYQVRTKPNGYTAYEAHEGEPEVWVKLVRIGNMVSGYISTDGENWELNCEIIVKLGGCYKAGLVVNSNTEDTYNTALFSDVSLVNIEQRSAFDNNARPFGLALEDPCKFEIENRDDIADCDPKGNNAKAEVVKSFPTFPNPARDVVNVDLNEFIGEQIEVRLISRRGKVVYKEKFSESPFGLSMPLHQFKVSTGIYTLQIISPDGIFSKAVSIIDEY